MSEILNVYVIGPAEGPQKIGVAANPETRRQTLQVASLVPLQLSLSLALPRKVAVAVENYAHWLLKEVKVRGEWFRLSPAEAKKVVRDAHEAVKLGQARPRERPGVGRKKLWAENVNLTLPAGAKARMDAALDEGEDRLDLIRKAIDRELKRREKKPVNNSGT